MACENHFYKSHMVPHFVTIPYVTINHDIVRLACTIETTTVTVVYGITTVAIDTIPDLGFSSINYRRCL